MQTELLFINKKREIIVDLIEFRLRGHTNKDALYHISFLLAEGFRCTQDYKQILNDFPWTNDEEFNDLMIDRNINAERYLDDIPF